MIVQSNIDPELPWGYWLRLEEGCGPDAFVDDEGRTWPSIRSAFWSARLGFQEPEDPKALEHLLAVLICCARGISWHDERRADLFGGIEGFSKFFDRWLLREGLVDHDPSRQNGKLQPSAEGRSVMLMLGATRPQPVRAVRPSFASVQELVSLCRAPSSLEDRLRETEAASATWPAAFARRDVGRQFTIVLEKRDAEAPVPVTRVVWSLPFADERARDLFFEWLCERVDRWAAWATLAWTDSGAALNGRLLSLVALCLTEERVANG